MPSRRPAQLPKEDRIRLMSELEAPYRGVRQFIYVAVGASGALGAFVFFFRVLAARDLAHSVPSLALQLGVLAAAIALFRWEQHLARQQRSQIRTQLEADELGRRRF